MQYFPAAMLPTKLSLGVFHAEAQLLRAVKFGWYVSVCLVMILEAEQLYLLDGTDDRRGEPADSVASSVNVAFRRLNFCEYRMSFWRNLA